MKRAFNILRFLFLITITLWAANEILQEYQYTKTFWDPNRLNQDSASGWENRLRGIKDDLPKTGIVGYVSEQDYPGASYSATDQDEEFALSLYSLAPVILDRGNTQHELVIGNFAGEDDYRFETVLGIRMITNYGYGIYLFEGLK